MTLKGDYSGLASYDADDVVGFQGTFYRAVKANTGRYPTDTLCWERLGKMPSIAAKFASDTGLTGKLINGLSQATPGKALDAKQGKVLKELILDISPDAKTLVLESSTEGSTKKFAITVNDSGELSADEIGGE